MQEIISSLLDVKIIIELYVQRFIFNKRPVDYALALQVHKYWCATFKNPGLLPSTLFLKQNTYNSHKS